MASLDPINVGDFGFEIVLTWTVGGEPESISGSDVAFVFTSPYGVQTSAQAAYVTDGSDGQATYTVPEGLFNVRGDWKVQMRLTQADQVQLTSQPLTLPVGDHRD